MKTGRTLWIFTSGPGPNGLMNENIGHIIAVIYGVPFIWIGVKHFIDPEWFEPIVPEILGSAKFWVYASGAFEILLGIGIILPQYRSEAALGMALMLVALYWANLNMWINDIPIGGNTFSNRAHVIRGIIQAALIGMALWIGDWIPTRR